MWRNVFCSVAFCENNAQNIKKNGKSDKWVLHKKNKNGNKLQTTKNRKNKSAMQTIFAEKNRKQSLHASKDFFLFLCVITMTNKHLKSESIIHYNTI